MVETRLLSQNDVMFFEAVHHMLSPIQNPKFQITTKQSPLVLSEKIFGIQDSELVKQDSTSKEQGLIRYQQHNHTRIVHHYH